MMHRPPPGNTSRAHFQQFIDREMASLLKTLSYYVVQAGLADRTSAHQEATELLNEVNLCLLAIDIPTPGPRGATSNSAADGGSSDRRSQSGD
ncbi:MAG: hypothetical protein ACYDBJ_26585 [Aggregatilineales bacterium]